MNDQQKAIIHKAIGDGHFDAYDEVMTTTDWTSLDGLFFQKVPVQKPGYGYNLRGNTPKLSLVVLILYSLIAFVYLAITCLTGRTSASWDSIGELLMLAFNSKRPSFLGRTSAGVKTLNTYRQPVSLMVNEQDGLELVFDGDPDNDKRLYRRVAVTTPY